MGFKSRITRLVTKGNTSSRPTLPAYADHSLRNDSTGFAVAALTAWKLTVSKAITIDANPAMAKIHQLRLIR